MPVREPAFPSVDVGATKVTLRRFRLPARLLALGNEDRLERAERIVVGRLPVALPFGLPFALTRHRLAVVFSAGFLGLALKVEPSKVPVVAACHLDPNEPVIDLQP